MQFNVSADHCNIRQRQQQFELIYVGCITVVHIQSAQEHLLVA